MPSLLFKKILNTALKACIHIKMNMESMFFKLPKPVSKFTSTENNDVGEEEGYLLPTMLVENNILSGSS